MSELMKITDKQIDYLVYGAASELCNRLYNPDGELNEKLIKEIVDRDFRSFLCTAEGGKLLSSEVNYHSFNRYDYDLNRPRVFDFPSYVTEFDKYTPSDMLRTSNNCLTIIRLALSKEMRCHMEPDEREPYVVFDKGFGCLANFAYHCLWNMIVLDSMKFKAGVVYRNAILKLAVHPAVFE